MGGIGEELPVCWRVRAVDGRGVVQYEQDFVYHMDDASYNPEKAADNNARRITELFPECKVTVESLTFTKRIKR